MSGGRFKKRTAEDLVVMSCDSGHPKGSMPSRTTDGDDAPQTLCHVIFLASYIHTCSLVTVEDGRTHVLTQGKANIPIKAACAWGRYS